MPPSMPPIVCLLLTQPSLPCLTLSVSMLPLAVSLRLCSSRLKSSHPRYSLPATVLDSSQSSLAPAAEARLSHSPRPFKQNPLCESRVKAPLCLSSPHGSPGQPSIMLLCLSSRNGWLMRKRPVQKFGKYKIRVQGWLDVTQVCSRRFHGSLSTLHPLLQPTPLS